MGDGYCSLHILENSLYWGSLYQGLSVPFFIPFPKISILGHCCTCWEYLYTFLYFIYLISVAFTKIFSNINPYFSFHSPLLLYTNFFFDGIRSKIFDFAVMSVSNFPFQTRLKIKFRVRIILNQNSFVLKFPTLPLDLIRWCVCVIWNRLMGRP